MIYLDGRLPVPARNAKNDRVHFFKYMNENTAKIVLRNRTLRWSTTSQLNDPFEMQFDIAAQIDKALIKNAALEKLWELYTGDVPIAAKNAVGAVFEYLRVNVKTLTKNDIFSEFGPAIDEGLAVIEANAGTNTAQIIPMFSKIKILSLTVRPDINLMWAHYANSHKGVVLRLRSIPALDSPYSEAIPVQYSDEVPAFFTETFLINSFCGIETVDPAKLSDSIVYRKTADWAYEQEWRVETGFGRNKDEPFEDLPFGWNELDGVIFGLSTTDEDKTAIRDLCKRYPNVEFMQATKVAGTSTLDIEPME